LIEISRHPKAIAQYGLDTPQRLKAITKIETDFPGLLLKGSIKEGIGIADRVSQAYKTAEELSKS
jgi:oxygen-dependent protoporphyrinogen oxidase